MAANSSGCVPMALTFSPPWGRTRYSILSSFRGIRSRRYSLRALYHIARPEQARPGIGRPGNGLYPHIYMLYITVLRHAGVAKSARPWYHRLTRTCLSLSIDGTVKKQVLWRDTLENGSSGFAAQRRAAVHPAADQPDAAAQLAGHHGTAGHYYHAIYRRGHGGPPGRVPVGGSGAGGLHHLAVRRAVLRGSYGLQRADGAAGGRRPPGRGAQHPQAGAGAVPGLQRGHGGAGGGTVCAAAPAAAGGAGDLAGCLCLFPGVQSVPARPPAGQRGGGTAAGHRQYAHARCLHGAHVCAGCGVQHPAYFPHRYHPAGRTIPARRGTGHGGRRPGHWPCGAGGGVVPAVFRPAPQPGAAVGEG